MVMRVPRGFLSDIGLADVYTESAITFTPRELNMFNAAIRKEKSNGTIDILSRPQILVRDNQMGQFRMGGQDVIPVGMEIVDGPNGPVLSMKKQKFDTGLNLAVTPRITPDGKSIIMRVDVNWTEITASLMTTHFTVPPELTGLKEAIKIPIENRAINVDTCETTVQMKDGETVIMRGPGSEKAAGDKQRASGGKSELLIILTPHCVRTSAPVPAVQPAARSEAIPLPSQPVVLSPGGVRVEPVVVPLTVPRR
jgi:Flp pilus assembly secretin CpaC